MVYFNDEQSSNTYMEPVTTCPGCISTLFAYRVEGERVILRSWKSLVASGSGFRSLFESPVHLFKPT